MKAETTSNLLAPMVLALLCLAIATPVLCGDEVQEPPYPVSTEGSLLEAFDIHGVVMDMTTHLSEEEGRNLRRLGQSEEGQQAFQKTLKIHAACNAVVTLRGDSIQEEVVADAQGRFRFVGFTDGEYVLSARAPS